MMTDEQKTQIAHEQTEIRQRMGRIKHKILILSGKGGVGKSTVAVNLAASLTTQGYKVGLLDVDIHGPSVPQLLGIKASRAEALVSDGSSSGLKPVAARPNLSVMSIGFLLNDHDDAVIWRGPMKHNMIKQFLKDVAWGDLDYLIVDSPPGTGDEPLAVVQLLEDATGAVIVTTPQDLAVSDVRKCITFCRHLALPILGVIENMSGFVCPSCGERVDIFKAGGGQKMADEMGIPFLNRIPIDPQLVDAGDSGAPYLQRLDKTETAQAFAVAVEAIVRSTKSDDEDNTPKKEKQNMKIAIPIVEGKLSAHFGHCETFALIDVDSDNKTVTATEFLQPPAHEPGVLPRWLAEQGAEIIIAGGMGNRAQGLFQQQGIQVIVGAPTDVPETIVNAYLNGALKTGENVCDH